MLQTMSRYLQTALCWTFLSAVVLVGPMLQPVWAADKKPLLLDVLLPADAELEVNGQKTKSTGETRRFESSPMPTERTYAYTLKVVWRGQTLTQRIELQPDKLKTVDLRDELQALAAPKPKGSFALLVPPALTLAVGQKALLPLRVKRIHFPDPICITFADLPKGITIPEVTFSANQSEGQANVSVAADAPLGTQEIHVLAHSGSLKDESTVKITFVGSEKKTERKAETKSPQTSETAPALQLMLPDRVEVEAGRTQLVEVQVKTMNGSPLPRAPRVTLTIPAEAHLRSDPNRASTFQVGRPRYNAGFTLRAAPEAPAGEYAVSVAASAGWSEIKGVLTVRVKKAAPMPLPAPKPGLKLSLVPPHRPTLRAGQSRYVEIKVTAENGAPFPAEPVVTLAGPPESKLSSAVWTIFDCKNNSVAYTVGFAVRAAADAPPGEKKMKVLAAVGKAKTEYPIKFLVNPPERKPAAQPVPVLQLVLPDRVDLPAGRTKYLEVQVKTADHSPLPAEPKVTLETPPKARVRAVPWTYSFTPGQSSCTVGLAVTAEADGSPGDYQARVRALDGRGKTEGILKVTVHK